MSEQSNPYGVPDTGHVWDDNLRELTNPPPKWWMLGFYASIALVIIYGILYPMWPLAHGYTHGVLGWTQIKEYKQDMKSLQQKRAKWENLIKGKSAAQMLANPEMKTYAIDSAKTLFGDKCAACHGAGGQGNPGFPVLADDDWLYGGDINTIVTTITNGRHGMMPSHVNSLTPQEIDDVAKYVWELHEGKVYEPGRAIFMGKGACFACHGADAKGMHAMGSANLTDNIWRFAAKDQMASIKYTITHGVNDPSDKETRNAVMPEWKTKLTKEQINKLAVFVHELGGGQ